MARGFFFSADLALAAAMLLLMLAALLLEAESSVALQKGAVRGAEKELLASALSEAIVKSRNAQNPALGAAYHDAQKRRVQANLIDPGLLRKIRPSDFGPYSLAGIYTRDYSGAKYVFGHAGTMAGGGGSGCIAVERFVLIAGLVEEKAALGVVVCEK